MIGGRLLADFVAGGDTRPDVPPVVMSSLTRTPTGAWVVWAYKLACRVPEQQTRPVPDQQTQQQRVSLFRRLRRAHVSPCLGPPPIPAQRDREPCWSRDEFEPLVWAWPFTPPLDRALEQAVKGATSSYRAVDAVASCLHGHPAPQPQCGCGFHAVSDPATLAHLKLLDDKRMVGLDVVLSGRVVAAEWHDGAVVFRAERQSVARFRTVDAHSVDENLFTLRASRSAVKLGDDNGDDGSAGDREPLCPAPHDDSDAAVLEGLVAQR